MALPATASRATLLALLLVLPGVSAGAAPPQTAEPAASTKPAAPERAAPEDERALEREEAAKLRRLREEQDRRRREAARKLDAELKRQAEVSRLRATLMSLEQRESTLHHEVRSLQQQLGMVPRDPSDHSAMTRRMDLERQLGYTQNQLNYATRSREGAARQLDDLRPRY
jgi:predicted nuclease with TOPRIM domain